MTKPANSSIKPRQTRRQKKEKDGGATVVSQPQAAEPNAAKTQSKIAMVIALLRREQGAPLDEMVEATRWLPHTTRAALTGLRKKGHTITRGQRGEVSCYRVETRA